MQYTRTSLALCVEESAWNVLIFLEILFALHLVSRLKHSLKDTVNPICNQLLASLYQQSSTQALVPEKERTIGGDDDNDEFIPRILHFNVLLSAFFGAVFGQTALISLTLKGNFSGALLPGF